MTDNHSQSFFGQTTGLTIQSSSKSDPCIFIKCIKKKPDNSWEKPSLGEGKTIKCSLDEMVLMLQVLKGKTDSWASYHTFKETNTQISFNWKENQGKKLWIKIGTYSKMLGPAQVEIFKLLLKHLIKEKIKYATVPNISKLTKDSNNINNNERKEMSMDTEKINLYATSPIKASTIKNDNSDLEKVKISGVIKAETEKAILIVFSSGKEIWIPKSIIHSNYLIESDARQEFIADNWFLKKNKIPI